MDSCDILIAGGGPAGSSCAWGLRSSGLHVVILDKARFPRDKICGGWITPNVFEVLQITPEDYASGRTLQPILGFAIHGMEPREVSIPYGKAVSFGIRRCEFDEYLLRRSSAEIREGVPITRVERADNGWIVNGDLKTRVLVGAGGHFCPVSCALGNAKGNSEDAVVAQEIEFEMDAEQAGGCAIQPEIPELYFCRDLLGYGWCFRKRNFLNIGLGRLDPHSLRDHVGAFLNLLRGSGKLGFNPPNSLRGHAYLLMGRSGRRLVDDSVLLIGDSAGLAYSQSGEGIGPAVESGLMAAQAIQSAKGTYSRAQLEGYPAQLHRRYRHSPVLTAGMARHVPRELRNSLGRLLLRQRWFCRRVVIDNWFLHVADRV